MSKKLAAQLAEAKHKHVDEKHVHELLSGKPRHPFDDVNRDKSAPECLSGSLGRNAFAIIDLIAIDVDDDYAETPMEAIIEHYKFRKRLCKMLEIYIKLLDTKNVDLYEGLEGFFGIDAIDVEHQRAKEAKKYLEDVVNGLESAQHFAHMMLPLPP